MLEHEVRQILARDKETGALMLDWASGQWQIRQGNFITLSEAFWFGKELCSCYDIYRWYLTLPVWIQKRYHSAYEVRGSALPSGQNMCGAIASSPQGPGSAWPTLQPFTGSRFPSCDERKTSGRCVCAATSARFCQLRWNP